MFVLFRSLLQMSVAAELAAAVFLSVLIGAIASSAMPESTLSPCQQRIFTGPDGRLSLHLIGRMPKSAEPIVGFEIIGGRPLVALPRELLGFTERGVNEMAVSEPMEGLSVNRASRIELQTSSGFLTMGGTGVEPDKPLTNDVHGRLFGSGNQVFLEVRAHGDLLQFIARTQNGRPFLIATVKGKLHAASWNDIGLAAVVDNSLYIWQTGAKSVVRLLTDQGLSGARDVALAGSDRAIVSLKNNVVLVTSETITVVMGIPLAHCRFQDGVLYLLDSQSRWIWSVRELDQLGTRKGDQAYAADLLKQLPKNADERAVRFREAARILGCGPARQQLANR
jgi:hypothetical protein